MKTIKSVLEKLDLKENFEYIRDKKGRLLKFKLGKILIEKKFDSEGRLIYSNDGNKVIENNYRLGKLLSQTENGKTTYFKYNSKGEICETLTDGIRNVFKYKWCQYIYKKEGNGWIISQQDTYSGGKKYTTTTKYNTRGEVTQINYPDGGSDIRIYDKKHRIIRRELDGKIYENIYNDRKKTITYFVDGIFVQKLGFKGGDKIYDERGDDLLIKEEGLTLDIIGGRVMLNGIYLELNENENESVIG